MRPRRSICRLPMGNASQCWEVRSLPLCVSDRDRIVRTRAEHHANIVPWQQLCERTGGSIWTPDGRK